MIKFLDLKKINDSFEPGLRESIQRVLNSGWYLFGEEVKAFESEYARFTGTKHCISVANGLDALRLILRGYMELGEMHPGHEIIVPANTYIASMLAVSECGLKPVLVEPDDQTCNIDPDLIEGAITSNTRGIMIVHLYGRNAMNEKIAEIAERHKLRLIEDNAQAHGCYNGTKRTGSLGNAAGHSFYPGKNLGALGDAGAVTTDDDKLASVVRAIANYGSSAKYTNDYPGINSRMDELQAAVLRKKLERLDEDNRKRDAIASQYLSGINHPRILLPSAPEKSGTGMEHVWHLFVLRSGERDELQRYLASEGIQTMLHYPIPPHRQKAYRDRNRESYPITESIHKEVLSIPISPVMEDSEVKTVIEKINGFRHA